MEHLRFNLIDVDAGKEVAPLLVFLKQLELRDGAGRKSYFSSASVIRSAVAEVDKLHDADALYTFVRVP